MLASEFISLVYLDLKVDVKHWSNEKSIKFELDLDAIDLVNDFFVKRFDKEFIFYEISFNGTVQDFINIMQNKNYNINTQKKIWTAEWEI